MSIELSAQSRRDERKGAVRPDNQLSFFDQASFLLPRATGRGPVMQCAWIYEHPVDIEGLRRFHRNFGYGLYGRLIERSPLPFGRHRWVSAVGPPAEIDFGVDVRDRAELSDWVDERVQLPIDPEFGPGWHLGVQQFSDGSTAVSLVGSHCLCDGVGALLAISDAVNGNTRDLGYPPPRSRTRLGALVADTRQVVRGAPELARTLVAAARLAVRRRGDFGRSGAARPATGRTADGDRSHANVVLPAVTVFVDTADWDARADALGGNTYSLLAGFAAKLGERMGRLSADNGAVALRIAISERTRDDTRAHAIAIANANVDPKPVTTDLSAVRQALRQVIATVRTEPDEALQVLPLIPLVPKRAMKRLADVFLGAADLPVTCSNVGDLDPAVGRPDGTDAEYVFQRGIDQNVTRHHIERDQGQLVLVSGRIGGRISIDIVAYQPGEPNTKARLRELAARTLAEFDLTGTII